MHDFDHCIARRINRSVAKMSSAPGRQSNERSVNLTARARRRVPQIPNPKGKRTLPQLKSLQHQCHPSQTAANQRQAEVQTKATAKPKRPKFPAPCYSCGGKSHWQKDCWYKNSTCKKCGRNGHIAKACKNDTQIRRVRAVATDSVNDTHIHTVSIKPKCMAIEGSSNKWWKVTIQINRMDHPMNVDTAAQITVITADSWQKLGKPTPGKTVITVRSCNEKAFPIEGKFKCQVSYNAMKPISSQINDEKSLILALQTNYANIFGPELGHCTKFRAHLILKKEETRSTARLGLFLMEHRMKSIPKLSSSGIWRNQID
ncbi:hypothetical protein niasHT_029964 [Heterodera trifolii]|uniref:CCHC-type domain-containing protein n=1 Tax=Heterodera trifolii TaxID=157864 RepID=A0ABD2JVN0_9BILA